LKTSLSSTCPAKGGISVVRVLYAARDWWSCWDVVMASCGLAHEAIHTGKPPPGELAVFFLQLDTT